MLATLRSPAAASRAYRHLATRSLLSNSRRAAATLVSKSDKDPAAPPKPKRISPYRLVPARTFLSAFAPLHAQGWRLNSLKGGGVIGKPAVDEDGDLQDYELVRTYGFEMHKDGWRRAMALVGRVGEVVEQQDHHPKILLCPASDLPANVDDVSTSSNASGYAVQISTHTHTPLPPPAHSVEAQNASPSTSGSKPKMRPGVTTKDLRLAQAVEGLWEQQQ